MKENRYANLDKTASRTAYLIAAYIRGTISEQEHDELDDWVNASDQNMQLFEELTDEKNMEQNLAWMDKVNTEQSYEKLWKEGKFKKHAKKFQIRRTWIAAASLLLAAGIFFIYRYSTNKKLTTEPPVMAQSILQPGGNKATLTLENGSVIDLSTARNGLLNTDSAGTIIKVQDGKMVYDDDDITNTVAMVHTLRTPVGGQFRVTLPDGSMVWLNSSSSLTYPSRFTGNERLVKLTGEAYFEVAKDLQKPFRVESSLQELEVLGTHFNINAYTDEPSLNTTLLEGSVKVSVGPETKLLTPGQQSKIINGIIQVTEVDTGDVIAWKNNTFKFTDAPIEIVMRQIQRWYGAEIIYRDKVNFHFNAAIDRTEPVADILHYLEGTGQVHFKIDNKKIIVMK